MKCCIKSRASSCSYTIRTRFENMYTYLKQDEGQTQNMSSYPSRAIVVQQLRSSRVIAVIMKNILH